MDDGDFLPLVAAAARGVASHVKTLGASPAQAAGAEERVLGFVERLYVEACAANDPDGADARTDAACYRSYLGG